MKAQRDLSRKVIVSATGWKLNCDEAEASSVHTSFKKCNGKGKARKKKYYGDLHFCGLMIFINNGF